MQCSYYFITMLLNYLLIFLFATLVCGLRDDLDHFLSGGFRAKMQMAPWHAGLYSKAYSPYMQICGGTLISKTVVVSAAHCFSRDRQKPLASDYAVAVGKIYRPWNEPHDIGAQKSDVKDYKIPPRYQGSLANFQDDIALIIVEKEFQYTEYVKPACFSFDLQFDQEQLQEGKLGKIVGWGLTGENSHPSQVLQAAILPSVSIDKCIDESPAYFRSSITGDKICAGYKNGTAVCRGDSGGGLMFSETVEGFEKFFLRGIVSTSPTTENQCNIHTWATFTHLLRHEQFVKSVVSQPDDSCLQKTSDEGLEERYAEAPEAAENIELSEPAEPTERTELAQLTSSAKIPRLQRCQCTCPAGTTKTRHGKYLMLPRTSWPIRSEVRPAVGGGYRVKFPNKFPWHVGLYTKTTRPYMQICGGTIVTRDIVITAAHCLSQDRHIPPASQYAVAAGKVYRPWNETHDGAAQKSDVKEIRIPPRYQGPAANYQDDIAVLILVDEFAFDIFVKAACVNFDSNFEGEQLQEGNLGKIVGWGMTGENSGASQVLQAATLPIVSIEHCIETSPASFRSAITGDKICAGYNNGTAVCRGDSGGGLVFLAKWRLLELAFLRGVVSTSPTSENKCNIHTWATFTHISKHERFLKSVVPDIEKCGLPTITNHIELRAVGIDNGTDSCCPCEPKKPLYEVVYREKTFSLDL